MISNDSQARRLSEEIAGIVKGLREKDNQSKSSVSEKSGLSRQAVLYVETMQRSPSVETLYSLTKALGVPLWKVIKEAEQKAEKAN